MYTWPVKDPNEVLDYQFVWTDRLAVGETISTSSFIREQGDVTIGANDVTAGVATVWLSGGTVGTVNVFTNRIVTNKGRTYDESARLRVRSSAT